MDDVRREKGINKVRDRGGGRSGRNSRNCGVSLVSNISQPDFCNTLVCRDFRHRCMDDVSREREQRTKQDIVWISPISSHPIQSQTGQCYNYACCA